MPVSYQQFLARKKQRAAYKHDFRLELLIFLIGALGTLVIKIGGDLPISEILTLLCLPVLLMKHNKRIFRPEYRWFYILLSFWLVDTILDDLVLGVSTIKRIKGVARIIYLCVDFMVLAGLIDFKPRRTVAFLLGIMVAFLYPFLVLSSSGPFDTRWKFGGSSVLAIGAFLVCCFFYKKKRYYLCVAISCGVALCNLLFAFRSQFVIALISGILVLPVLGRKAQHPGTRPQIGADIFRLLFAFAAIGGLAFLGNQAILYAARHDFFDEGTTQKFEDQASGKYGVLLGGRPETLVAIQAIRDSPIIGHGSYAIDPKYLQMESYLSHENGYENMGSTDNAEAGIPTHSHLTLAWVESGLFGGVFWIYILGLTLYGVLLVFQLKVPLTPVYLYVLFNFTWDILYSPMGAFNRIWNSFTILIALDLIRHRASCRTTSTFNRPLFARRVVRLKKSAVSSLRH